MNIDKHKSVMYIIIFPSLVATPLIIDTNTLHTYHTYVFILNKSKIKYKSLKKNENENKPLRK